MTDNYGCAAKDSVKIDLFCSQNLVFIPSAFTPNKDGVNDRFNIKGNGVKTVRHLRIFNRWGEAVFEKNNFNIDDRAAGWDGTYRNIVAPLGAYVYMIELVCDTNEVFDYKGTVTLIR